MKRGLQAFFGAVLLVMGLVAASGGGFLAVLVGPEGEISTPAGAVAGEGYALVLNEFSIDTAGDPNTVRSFADFQVGAESTENERIFMGIAPAAEVNRYLASSARDVVSDISGGTARIVPIPGAIEPGDPADETFWDAQAEGANPVLSLEQSGVSQSLVIMNSNASEGVSVNLTLGLVSAALFPIGLGLLIIGVLLLLLGVLLIIKASRGRKVDVTDNTAATAVPAPVPTSAQFVTAGAATQTIPPVQGTQPQSTEMTSPPSFTRPTDPASPGGAPAPASAPAADQPGEADGKPEASPKEPPAGS